MDIPESQRQHTDLIDVLMEGSQTVEEVEARDGTMSKQLVLDPKKVWYKTHLINAATFGRFAFELETFESMAPQCFHNMSLNRASVMASQINKIGENFEYSVDAKSSESLRDSHNSQGTLIDKIIRNKSERIYTMKGEAGKSMWSGIMGKDREKDEEHEG